MSSKQSVSRYRLKYAATINDQALGEETDPDFEIQYVDIGNVDSSGTIHEIAPYRFADAPSRARRQVRNGDVIISCVRTYLQAIAPIQNPPDNLIVSTGFAVIRPRTGTLDATFGKYALREPRFLAEVEMHSVGVSYPAINASDLGDIAIYLPPAPQQEAIAAYLDRETARLDALVAAKERVLGLLAEKRRALITRAVTRGLDPRAPLRESGIPWTGEIPAHWQSRRLKFLSPQITVGIVVTPAKYYETSGVPCLRSLNVRETGLSDLDLVYISDQSNIMHSKSRVFAGDLVAIRSGQPGTTAVVDPRFHGANCIDLIIIRRSPTLESIFLSHFLNSEPAKMQFLGGSGGAIQQHFNIETAADLVVPVPPQDEQLAIIGHISSSTTKLDALRSATERTIALLEERRAALIAAAITGQIDFQGAKHHTTVAG